MHAASALAQSSVLFQLCQHCLVAELTYLESFPEEFAQEINLNTNFHVKKLPIPRLFASYLPPFAEIFQWRFMSAEAPRQYFVRIQVLMFSGCIIFFLAHRFTQIPAKII
ncbi:hypothetical protein BKA67DRAFT_391276 [Truncatella angustata]|uniref:Uncharacterized protein n=1 Tax=Truncatella angustata TaxID=152316 RepID=A0A9P8RQI9_9PEZI|nr:uncharacterized protein BKA67DRAFT_391276 [Truncatella angustata]KAH6647563.1 hypothetical protein BKA67DRAFT_391276 [Truncatella angustata]